MMCLAAPELLRHVSSGPVLVELRQLQNELPQLFRITTKETCAGPE